jgi:hypothetical protein
VSASTAEIIDRVRKRCSIPANQDRFVDADLVAFIKEELEETVIPTLQQINKEFMLVRAVVPLQDDSGTVLYPAGIVPIPSRAFARSLREIKFLDDAGNEYNLPQIALEDTDVWNSYRNSSVRRLNSGYCLYNDGIYLFGDPNSILGSIRYDHMVRCPAISASTTLDASIMNLAYNATTLTTTFTVASVPADLATYCPTTGSKLFDVYRKSTGALLYINLPLTRTGSTFAGTSLSADDYQEIRGYQNGGLPLGAAYDSELSLVPAAQLGYSPIPPEADNMLVVAVAGRVLESLGDTEGLKVNDSRMARSTTAVGQSLGTGNEGESSIITNRRGVSAQLRRRWGWW